MTIVNACPHCQAEVEFDHEEVPDCSGVFTTINPHRKMSKGIPASFRPMDEAVKSKPVIRCPLCQSTDVSGPYKRLNGAGQILLVVGIFLVFAIIGIFLIAIAYSSFRDVTYKCNTCGKTI